MFVIGPCLGFWIGLDAEGTVVGLTNVGAKESIDFFVGDTVVLVIGSSVGELVTVVTGDLLTGV